MEKSPQNSKKKCELSSEAKSMDLLNVFGEVSSNSFLNVNSNRVGERLNRERFKAFKTLEKSQNTKNFLVGITEGNKENIKSQNNSPNCTEYVPYQRHKTINISDLVIDKTINLEGSSVCPPSNSKDMKISFEPAEMTGRSTLYKRESKSQNFYGNTRLSVSDILASSFAPKARNLCETLRTDEAQLDINNDNIHYDISRVSSTASSSIINFNTSRSLPRTADLSYSKALSSDVSLNTGNAFSFAEQDQTSDNKYSMENFEPGELMQSQLLNDEISWAQKYAAMPETALSKEAMAKRSSINKHSIESPLTEKSLFGSDPNFSVGTFFKERSESISAIALTKSPEKCRTPFALVDEDESTITTTNRELSSSSNSVCTPKIDNRTYSKFNGNISTLKKLTQVGKQENKDSGNSSENSYYLSMSAIDRALGNLDLNTDDSDGSIVNKILVETKKLKGGTKKEEDYADIELKSSKADSTTAEVMMRMSDAMIDFTLENKENCDPRKSLVQQLSDTMSFTDSILNSTDMKQLQRSISQTRSPLSPIQIVPAIHIEELGNEADIDEFPSTPVKSPNRRTRRKKPSSNSPRNVGDSVISSNEVISEAEETTPVNKPSNQSKSITNDTTPTQTHSSTLIAGNKNSMPKNHFIIPLDLVNSPISKSRHGVITDSSTNSSLIHYDCSPMSSPISAPSSLNTSPSCRYLSPNWENGYSDQRCLTAGALRKVVTSPIASDSCTSQNRSSNIGLNGVVPLRSCASLRSVTGAPSRSGSRCSNSSEFSHRDGKVIPLKVTTLDLSWGSTKLRTDTRKSMQIKNTSSKRLVVRIEIHGPGFQIVNTQSNILTLQSQECRSIVISFCPTVIGAAIGMLSFHSPQGTTASSVPFLDIPLYGYGGHASIIPQGILKGPVGTAFLPMGEFCELVHPLERSFQIYNTGPLLGFAIVCIDSIGLHLPRLWDCFEVSPRSVLIPAGRMVTIRVVFRPKRDDIKKILKKINNVLTLANMRIICGDEANRQRMRQLVQRMSAHERSKIASNSLDMLWTTFEDEPTIVEFETFKEQPKITLDLMSYIRVHEIAFTLNHDALDDTTDSSVLFPEADETVLFRTICAYSPEPSNVLDPVHELHEQTTNSMQEGTWYVTPNTIELDINNKQYMKNATLLIHNSFKSRQYFEVVCNQEGLLYFSPREGYVEPESGKMEIEISVAHDQQANINTNEEIMIYICMENERIAVPVKFKMLNPKI